MSDPYVTREMRIRDLLAHRSGLSLGAGDLLYWPTTTYTTREVAERLRRAADRRLPRAATPTTTSCSAWRSWSSRSLRHAVQALSCDRRIFQPLGMAETRYNSDDLKPGDNVATGHAKFDFKDLRPVGVTSWRNVSGAGGLYSSVHDLSKWMNVQLAGACLRGQWRCGETPVFRRAPARDVDGADPDPGRQVLGARPGAR
jgi:CubicO group peptidase (beta-lactamase class C family)